MRSIPGIFFLLFAITASAQTVIPLYDGQPPGTENWDWDEGISNESPFGNPFVYNVTQPSLTAFLPPEHLATGTAVVIAPGGGFHILDIESEGYRVAKLLQERGVAAFVLKYRLVRSYTDTPFAEVIAKADAQADMLAVIPHARKDGLSAVAYLRRHANDFNLKTDQIGLMGFSAGGNLTMHVAYAGQGDSLPDFVAPIYPAMMGLEDAAVPADTMPLFLAVAADDQLQLMPASLKLFQKWTDNGRPAELHIYEKGGHGFGTRQQNLPSDYWSDQFIAWLKVHGYLQKLNPNKYERLYGQDAVERGKLDKIKRMQTDYAQLSRYRAANAALPAPQPEEQRVVFLGNSITEGWVRQDSAFFAQNQFVGRGISGQTSPQLLLRFRQDVLDLDPFAVVIHIGTNDVAENTGPYDPEYTMSNIRSMVELAQNNGIKVILAAVLPATKFEWNRGLGDRSQMIIALNRDLAAYAQSENIPFVDYHAALTNNAGGMDAKFAADGVHPTDLGYAEMKQLILSVIGRVRAE